MNSTDFPATLDCERESHAWIQENNIKLNLKMNKIINAILTDTGGDSKLVHRRKRPKVDTLFSSLFSDASERRV